MRRSSALILSCTLALLGFWAFLPITTVPAQAEVQSETAKVTETLAPRTAPEPLRSANAIDAPHLPGNSITNSSVARENSLNVPQQSPDFPEGITAVPPPTNNLPVEWWQQRATQQADTPHAPIFNRPFPNPTPYQPLGQRETTYNGGRLVTYVPPNSTPLLNAPLAPTALYTITLQPLHRATNYPGFSSAFAFTNTGAVVMDYYLHFHWLNGQYVGSDGPFTLSPGDHLDYYMNDASFGETTFVGYVDITGDEPVDGQVISPPYGIIQGIVVQDDGLTPTWVHNVGSRAAYPDGQEYGNTYNLSDGRFYLGGLPDGDYNLWVHAPYPWARQWYNGHYQWNWQDADLLPISDEGTVAITVTLQPGGRITGTVYAADGLTPLPNVNVDTEQGGFGTCTDENGRYTIEGLHYDSYIIVAGRDWNWCTGQNSIYIPEFYPEASHSGDATIIDIYAGHNNIPDINFTLDIGVVVTGQVHDATTGLPMQGIQVYLDEYDNGGLWNQSWTDANGVYTITGLVAADYRVRVSPPFGYAQQYFDHQLYHHLADRVAVTIGGVVTDINFDLLPGGAITGTVYAADGITLLANINVDVENGGFGTCTDENGRYRINGLPYGDYKVHAGGGWNWCLNQSSLYIREYYPETPDPDLATTFTIDAATPLHTDVDFTLAVGGGIIGQVIADDTGLPLVNVKVIASDFYNGHYISEGRADASGVYTITGLYDGDYCVGTHDPIPDGYARQVYDGVQSCNDATPVPVTSGGVTGGIDFALQPGGVITGRVIDQNSGLPIANVMVDVHADNWGWGTCTDSAGYYTHRALPYGDYRVSSGGGWNWCQNQPGEYGQEYYFEKRFHHEADIVTLDGGTTPVPDINFTLEKGGYLAGNVRDDNLQPVPNLRMVAVQGTGDCPWCEQHIADTYTDANGDYLIGPIPPDSYAVLADANANGQLLVNEYYDDVYQLISATFVTVTSEMTTGGLDFILDPGVWITGHVTVPPGYSNVNIPVDAWKVDGIWYGVWRRTDANGDYILPVPPIYDSRWGVSARPEGPELMHQWAHQFDLAQHTHWDFDLALGGSIAGCVTDGGAPVPNLWVTANAGEMHNGDHTDANGCYAITNLPPSPNGYEIRQDNWDSGRMWVTYGGHEWGWQTVLPLEAGEFIGGIDFAAPLRGQLEGYVYESDGVTPIEGVRVVAMTTASFWEGYTQPDGYYTIDVPVGEHKLLYEMDDFWAIIPVYYPGGDVHSWAEATPIAVAALPTVTAVPDMLLTRPGAIYGQITDANSGDPLGGIHVVVSSVDPDVEQVINTWTCTDEFGNYFIERVWPGASVVQAIGTCGNWSYGLFTDTATIVAGGSHMVNFNLTADTMPPRPFTIKTNDSYNYSPIAAGHESVFYQDADQIVAALFEPLVQLDDTNTWISDMLVDIPTVANGGAAIIGDYLVVTYTLKPGLLWSDGAPVTSGDIRFTWEVLAQAHRHADSGRLATKIERVDTPDAHTAVLTYEFRQFPASYLGALMYLLPEHILAGQHAIDLHSNSPYSLAPIGNGPYMVASWVPGSHLDLIANPNYHKRGLGLPRIPAIRFLFTNSQFWSLAGGVADVSTDVTYDLPPDYQSFDLNFYQVNEYIFYNIYPNMERPYFAETAVRQALYHALDRERFVAAHWPMRSFAESWLPPEHPMYSDTIQRYSYDLGLAATMLDAAGWVDSNGNGIRDKNGVEFVFTLAYNEGNTVRQDLAIMFQADLATLGIDVNVVAQPWEEMINNATYGNFDAFTVGWWSGDRYEPAGYGLFHSDRIGSAYTSYWHIENFSRWRNSANDTLLEATKGELDAANLRALYAQHLALITQELPSWVTGHAARVSAAVPTLLNYRPHAAIPVTWNIEEWELSANPYDLTVRKTLAADSPAPQPGSDIIYAITMRNNGHFAVTGATLVDTLPADVVFVSANPAPTAISGQELLWELGTVPGGSTPQVIAVTVHIPVATPHGANLVNVVELFGDQPDSNPGNNGFSYQVTVRDDVDLAVTKFGVGMPAVGAAFNYYVDYANWGGAPASGAVLTDTLPPEVTFITANPAPDNINGDILTWSLPELGGNQWNGRIEITTTINSAGTVVNTADIMFGGVDADLSNNSAASTEQVDDILAPIITRPTQGVADGTPTIAGLAPSEAVVALWDLSSALNAASFAPATPTLLITTTADISGTFAVELTLAEGTYIVTAVAHKVGLSSDYSNTATFEVNHNLTLDTDSIDITADGATISRGVVRANKYTMPHRLLDVGATLTCAGSLTTRLNVTENGLHTYNVPAVSLTDLGSDQWRADFRLWMAEPHSTYDVWLEWECDGVFTRELLVYILIDPDGYVYDQSLVDAGSPITDSLILDAVVTAYVLVGDEWQVWPAHYYGQTNPQVTDTSTPDGVLEAGYYSFLTPPGQYRIAALAPGYQPYQSPVLTVVDTPIHLDIGLEPVGGGSGYTLSPANLAPSYKTVDQPSAWVGDTLTYDLWLTNSGEEATAVLTLTDLIPAYTVYVDGSLGWDSGDAGYDATEDAIWWQVSVPGGATVHLIYQVQVVGSPGTPFDVVNETQVTGAAANLATLGPLTAVTAIQNNVGLDLSGGGAAAGDPGTQVVYQAHIVNTGNSPDTFTFAADADWQTAVPAPITLNAGVTATLRFTITIPADALAGITDEATLTATSSLSRDVSETAEYATTVNQVVALTLTEAAPQAAEPGTTVTYTHQLQNLGNGVDTFVVTAVSDQGWPMTVSDNPTLDPGATATLVIVLQIPAEVAADVVETITLTVRSAFDNSAVATTTDVTTVLQEEYLIYLPVVIRP
jgi:peptide/nickel transport system substrate-binding protein